MMGKELSYEFMNELDVEIDELFKKGDMASYAPVYRAWVESGEKVLKITPKNSGQRTRIYQSMINYCKAHKLDWTIYKAKIGLDLYLVRAI